MKRKIVSLMFVALFAVIGLTGCHSTGGHSHEYTETIIQPTCTQDGYTLHTCSCGDSYKDHYTKARHEYENNKCSVCGAINPKYPYIQIPKVPISLTADYTICTVKKIETDDYYYTSTGEYSKTNIIFTVEKTYDSKGTYYSRGCNFGYKVYDEENIVVDSGTVYTEAIAVGETTKKTLSLYSLNGGKEYRLILLNIS